jgi:hypothetical protein
MSRLCVFLFVGCNNGGSGLPCCLGALLGSEFTCRCYRLRVVEGTRQPITAPSCTFSKITKQHTSFSCLFYALQNLRSVDCDKLAANAHLAVRRIFDAGNASSFSSAAPTLDGQPSSHNLFGLPPPLSDSCHLFARKFRSDAAEQDGINWFNDCEMIGLAPHCI